MEKCWVQIYGYFFKFLFLEAQPELCLVILIKDNILFSRTIIVRTDRNCLEVKVKKCPKYIKVVKYFLYIQYNFIGI